LIGIVVVAAAAVIHGKTRTFCRIRRSL